MTWASVAKCFLLTRPFKERGLFRFARKQITGSLKFSGVLSIFQLYFYHVCVKRSSLLKIEQSVFFSFSVNGKLMKLKLNSTKRDNITLDI